MTAGRIRFTGVLPDGRRRICCWHGELRYLDPGYAPALATAGLGERDDWYGFEAGDWVARSTITNVLRVVLDDGRAVYFKRYVYPPGTRGRFFARPSRAQGELFGYRALADLGIPTLKVVAFSELRRHGALLGACIATEALTGAVNLDDYARDSWWDMPAAQRRRVYLGIREGLLRQLANVHGAGFFHKDLKWRNLLIRPAEPGAPLVWMDCPRAGFRRLRRRHAIMAELSALGRGALNNLSRAERIRTLYRYCERVDSGWDRQDLARAIERHQQETSSHVPVVEERRGRRQGYPGPV